ncbi:MAG: hypothetical protein RMJ36_04265, partial [Candidatus Calescibacterium sp.]|nr:hypothetical protein [Candidatus Calescibacterium sp.]MDW8132852.1 hypothetical protein [Candidatus Calescibacterium sp.]
MDQEVIIKNLINNFSIPNLRSFLLLKGFEVLDNKVRTSDIESQKFKNVEEILQVGEINLEYQKLLVFAIKLSDLNERSSKKRQYEIAKKLLILFQIDAGLFFFYNDQKVFRFSFVYSVPF